MFSNVNDVSSVKEIDYLFEDPQIPGQTYALVSIVGPNLQQKCNVYGIKIRGVADSLDKAKTMAQKLTKIDPDFDIYTVDVGKFFPLDVDPLELSNVEYQNKQLNELVKGYLENRENAHVEYERRKNDMLKKAIADGKSGKEEVEHPISILNRMDELNMKISQEKEQLEHLMSALTLNKTEYDKFTQDVKDEAELEFKKLKDSVNENSSSSSSSSSKVIN